VAHFARPGSLKKKAGAADQRPVGDLHETANCDTSAE
jgi:hypothetical protein